MLRNGKPYAYDLYPPLQPGFCPLCGERLKGDEPLAGQITFPYLGLPLMEFPLCAACQSRRHTVGDRENKQVAIALARYYRLDAPADTDPEDNEDEFDLWFVDHEFIEDYRVVWLAELVPAPRTDLDTVTANFLWLPDAEHSILRWGGQDDMPYRIERMPLEADDSPQSLMGELWDDDRGLRGATWEVQLVRRPETLVTAARGPQADTVTVQAAMHPVSISDGMRQPAWLITGMTESAQWMVAWLPVDEVRQPGYADAWLQRVCRKHAEVTQVGLPLLPAACFYFILRGLEAASARSGRPPDVGTFNAALEQVVPEIARLIGDLFIDTLGFQTYGREVPVELLREWATAYLNGEPADWLAGTANQLRGLEMAARALTESGTLARLAGQRRMVSHEIWWRRCFGRKLYTLARLGHWLKADGLLMAGEAETLRLQTVPLTFQPRWFDDAWRQWFEFQVWPTPAAAGLEFLCPGLKYPTPCVYDIQPAGSLLQASGQDPMEFLSKVFAAGDAMPEFLKDLSQTASGVAAALPDEALCLSVARALLDDAQAHRQYVPFGGYRIILPADLVLRNVFGIKALRLWFAAADEALDELPAGCWARDETDSTLPDVAGQPRGHVWWWSWADSTNQSRLPPYLWPIMQATLAAIYRDLVVAGETVMLEVKGAQGEAAEPRPAGHPRHRHRGKRDLPGRRYEVRGCPARNILWCDEAELQRVRRAAHGVRGHLMRLAPGRHPSAEALARARAYGLIPPDDCTFVRPHVRGLDPSAASAPDEAQALASQVRARGLYTLMAFTTQTPASAGDED